MARNAVPKRCQLQAALDIERHAWNECADHSNGDVTLVLCLPVPARELAGEGGTANCGKIQLAGSGSFMRLYVFALLLLLITACFISEPGAAQVIRINSFRPHPLLTAGDVLTVSASPSSVSFTLTPSGTALGSSAITITTSETGVSLNSSVIMYAYFASASSALSGGSPVSHIPTSAVFGRCPTGTPTTYTSFTGTGAFGGAGASLQVYSLTGGAISLGFSRTDVLSLEINLSGLPQQPAAAYTGSMFIEVQAM